MSLVVDYSSLQDSSKNEKCLSCLPPPLHGRRGDKTYNFSPAVIVTPLIWSDLDPSVPKGTKNNLHVIWPKENRAQPWDLLCLWQCLAKGSLNEDNVWLLGRPFSCPPPLFEPSRLCMGRFTSTGGGWWGCAPSSIFSPPPPPPPPAFQIPNTHIPRFRAALCDCT